MMLDGTEMELGGESGGWEFHWRCCSGDAGEVAWLAWFMPGGPLMAIGFCLQNLEVWALCHYVDDIPMCFHESRVFIDLDSWTHRSWQWLVGTCWNQFLP